MSPVAWALREAGADNVRVKLSAGTATFAMEKSLSLDALAVYTARAP